MDRQAWIAITLCVVGLIAWKIYVDKYAPRPVPQVAATPAATPVDGQSTTTSPNPGSTPLVEAAPSVSPAPSVAPFAEKTESLRNSDVDLRLTNRGGGISEVFLLNHTLENGQQVVLNSHDRAPIGAIIDQPEGAALPEFTIVRGEDGSIQFEHKSPEGITIHKRFSFPPITESPTTSLSKWTSISGTKEHSRIATAVTLFILVRPRRCFPRNT